MLQTLKLSTALTALLALAACGGGSGGGGGSDLLDDPSFGQLAAALDSSADAIGLTDEDGEFDPASPEDVLVPGGATYVGQVAVLVGDSIDDDTRDEVSDADILGQVELDVDFTATGGTMSGTMLDFVASDGEEFTGTVDIAEADLFVTTGVGYDSTLDGEIVNEDGVATDVDGQIIGAFAEDGYFVGIAGGEVSNVAGVEDFFGVIIASE